MTMDASSSSAAATSFVLLPEPIKGKSDWRDFRCIQLQNGVKVCLVHDKSSKTTAAAACVEAGAGADPRSLPGIA
jgi:secreted Zn-dependent insulinase-like peptidase